MKSMNTTSTDHCCHICNKYFTLKRNLTKHLKVVHHQIQKLDAKNGLHCPLDCKPRFITRKYALLRDHISSRHGVTIECEDKTFLSLEEFALWKHRIENQSACSYIAQTGPKRLSFGQKKTYYVCHRSGLARRASTGGRPVKYQVSCKVGTHCPSTLDLTQDEGKFHVKFYKTHAGHALELLHVTLTREERTDLAGKIMNGESFSKIIADVREELAGADTLTRRHLLSHRDLSNIKSELVKHGTDDARNEPTSGEEEVKRKLNLMLELIENVKLDKGSYSVLERVLDSSIEFVMENGTETTNASKEYPDDSSLISGEGDSADDASQTGNASCLSVRYGSFGGTLGTRDSAVSRACVNEASSARRLGSEVSKAVNTTGDLHPNAVRCAREERAARDCIAGDPTAVKDLHLDVIRFPRRRKPARRLLAKVDPRTSEQARDLHLNVIRCTTEDEPPSPDETTAFKDSEVLGITDDTGNLPLDVFQSDNENDHHRHIATTSPANDPSARENSETPPPPPGKTSELYLNVIKCTADNAVAFPDACVPGNAPEVSRKNAKTPSSNATQLNVFRCATRKKRPQENIITLRKRMRGSASSIRVYAFEDQDGKTLDMTDFDQVYGIDI